MQKEILEKINTFLVSNEELLETKTEFIQDKNCVIINLKNENLSLQSCLDFVNSYISYADMNIGEKVYIRVNHCFDSSKDNFELVRKLIYYNVNIHTTYNETNHKITFHFMSTKEMNEANWDLIYWIIGGQGFVYPQECILFQGKPDQNSFFDKNMQQKNDSRYQEKVMANRMKKVDELSIKDIPLTESDVQLLDNHFCKIKGQVLAFETRKLKNNKYLITFKLTDFTDTISVKGMLNKEITYKNGDFIEVSGMIKYDNYARRVIVSFSNEIDIKPIEAFGETKDMPRKIDRKRIELHAHSTFSTQDGLTSVSEYYKRMDDFEIEAFAFTDHENIQAYPEIEKVSKEKGIKPIYGVELNLFDENDFKIFYKGKDSTNNTLIGIDIETTGFSSVYENIIEISAYKRVNGELFEYSTLVKLDDYSTLTPKITELTTITKEMLISNGVDIKTALKGLVDFIDGGIIVAHNATFDVDFIQYQISKHLDLNKEYSFIDTLNFSRVILRDEMKRFGLGYVAKKLKIELEEHHRAIYDAKCCFEICEALLSKLEVFDVDDVNCPDFGTFEMTLKVNSKDSKKVMDDFLSSMSYDVDINDESTTSTTTTGRTTSRTNVTYVFRNLTDSEKTNIENFLKENTKIKLISSIKRINDYSENLEKLNDLIKKEDVLAHQRGEHITVLVKNQAGLKSLYKLISYCHINHVSKNIMCSLETLKKYKNNLLIGSSCMNGLFKKAFEKGMGKIDLSLYDYIEIQPKNCYLGISDNPYKLDFIKETVRNISYKAAKEGKTICATSDAHYIDSKLKEYRDVYIETPLVGGGLHPLFSATETGMHKLMSSSEMIEEMSWYDFKNNFIEKIIFDNPKQIYENIELVTIVKDKLYTPTNEFLKGKILPIVGHEVTNVVDEMNIIVNNALENYRFNGQIPEIIQKRVKKELDSIIGNGFAITYYIAYLLVKKSNSDGYVVGSRGSVGSSFVANLMGITEVNSLVPHYHCPHCHYSVFQKQSKGNNIKENSLIDYLSTVNDGYDLPNAKCPHCNSNLLRDGHDIPFETFLGFDGDKVPDIDLNFSGDYQWKAHNFCKEVFGASRAFRAGTIATVAENTAIAYYKKYLSKRNIELRQEEIERRSSVLQKVKRTSGQHPGGIIVIPENQDVFDFTPIQFPANDTTSKWYTTHFDYHGVLDETLLKLDILGHDDPTILKFLMDRVHKNPNNYPFNNVKDIPLLTNKEISKVVLNSLGVPELGTNFVRGMLEETRPTNFAELVKVSGLSHGTDVFTNNAQDLVNGKTKFGIIEFKDVIGCRDDIMVTLMALGIEPKKAFDIMEFVRKGKPSKEKEKWNEHKTFLKEHNIPDWYIWSCEQIKYMFPKAHAVAYVLSAMRIAWFKLYRPLDFYASFFTVRSLNAFDAKYIVSSDENIINERIAELKHLREEGELTQQEEDKIPYLEVALEMVKLGFKFEKPDINRSHASEFIVNEETKSLLLPFMSMNGVGESSAIQVFNEQKIKPFENFEDLKKRGKADKKFIEGLKELGVNIN